MGDLSTPSATARVYKIGQLSLAAGIPVRTIRYYDEIGLITPVKRSEGGFRLYDEAALKKLEFVKGARELGIGIPRVRLILESFDSRDAVCTHVDDAIADELRELDDQIERLSELRRKLLAVRAELRPRLSLAPATDCVCPVVVSTGET